MQKKTLPLKRKNHLYLYGAHACRQALYNKKRVIERMYFREIQKANDFFSSLDGALISWSRNEFFNRVDIIKPQEMDALLSKDSVHQGIVFKVQPLPPFDLVSIASLNGTTSCVLVLDQVTDPHNVGAILRSCAVFQVDAVVLCAKHSPDESGTLGKSASGALDIVPICRVPNLASALKELKTLGYWTVGLSDKGGSRLRDLDLKGKIAIVLGGEGDGIRKLTSRLCDFHGRIPTSPFFSTLNVSNAAAVALYEVFEQNNPNFG